MVCALRKLTLKRSSQLQHHKENNENADWQFLRRHSKIIGTRTLKRRKNSNY
jgi:hypothetical protein